MTREARFGMRLTPEELALFERAAQAEGHVSVSAWLRVVGLARARSVLKQQSQVGPSPAEKKSK